MTGGFYFFFLGLGTGTLGAGFFSFFFLTTGFGYSLGVDALTPLGLGVLASDGNLLASFFRLLRVFMPS